MAFYLHFHGLDVHSEQLSGNFLASPVSQCEVHTDLFSPSYSFFDKAARAGMGQIWRFGGGGGVEPDKDKVW